MANKKSKDTNASIIVDVETPKPETPQLNDPFDPAKLRMNQNFGESAGVKKLLTTVPVRKPNKQWFFRVRPGEEWRMNVCALELKEDREIYIIDQSCVPNLFSEVVPMCIFTAINRQGVVFLWPIRLPDESGKHNEWHRAAFEAAERAEKNWIRTQANMSLGSYEISVAQGDLGEPKWPEEDIKSLLKIGFRDKLINSLDHPVLKMLRGEKPKRLQEKVGEPVVFIPFELFQVGPPSKKEIV